ncbi:uncharacterized protein LOC105394308 [Plutella xylostella]|uniref:uncharacterized protein LOC105394308 n=1 Tax=Plutella xylostella TaxID=51655 RepID=UPI00203302C8|nr:uncharacterized protein LOC105394308 [Plutella xylostella]
MEAQCGRVSRGDQTLDILKEVQRAYEQRMDRIEQQGGRNKLELQVEVLRAWVSDLVSQNSLLVRVVEDLELEATSRLALERRKHTEEPGGIGKKRPFEKSSELKILYDSLQKENSAKDREIRRLNKDMQQYEQTIMNLRNEMNQCHCRDASPIVKKDAEIMTTDCSLQRECDKDEEAVKQPVSVDDDVADYYETLQRMEDNLKSSSSSIRTLRQVNVALSEEAHALRRVCAALDQQCRAAVTRAQFKDDLIREMRRQLKQAKAKHSIAVNASILDQQCRAAVTRAQFRDDIIREMRRQLKHAKAKLKEESLPRNFSKDLVESGDHEFVRQSGHGGDTARGRRATPRRGVHAAMDTPQQHESGSEGRGHRLAAGDDGMSFQSN